MENKPNHKNIPYDRLIFVCVNDKKGEKPSCGDHQGEAVFTELRRIAKEHGVHPRIRVTQAKCLGQCACGVNVMIHPENIWLKNITLDSIPDIVTKYL